MSGRIAVVTGATAGIGRAVTAALVGRRCPVVANGRRAARLAELAAEHGAEDVATVAGDAADAAVVERLLDTARDTFGGGTREANLIVVNAGRGLRGSVVDADETQWEEVVRTNVLGAARLIRSAARRMAAEAAADKARGRDWQDCARDIVVVGSTVGRHISPFSSMYGSTKFAVHAMAEAVRRELGPKGIRVTLIEPAFVESEFQGVAGYDPRWFEEVKGRIGPVLTPTDVAETICWAAGQPARVHVSNVLVRPTRQDYP